MDSFPLRSEGKRTVVDETSLFADMEFGECFINFPSDEANNSPLDLEWIQRVQFEDVKLKSNFLISFRSSALMMRQSCAIGVIPI